MKKRFSFILFFFLLFHISRAEQSRALWVVRYALLQDDAVEQIMRSALLLKITDLYVQVRASGKFFFSSENPFNGNDSTKALQNFLRLKDEAGRRRIKIHAWLNVLNIWSSTKKPADRGHIYYLARNSILRKWGEPTGEMRAMRKLGIEGFFLDPADPVNLEHLHKMIRLLLTEYKVDGIHLDYFRYPSLEVSSSPALRSRFILQEYLDPQTLFLAPQTLEQSTVVNMSTKYRFFLSKSLTKLLANMRFFIHSLRRDAELSIAVKPDPLSAKTIYFQDWALWLERGLCDKVITMNYASDAQVFSANLKACSSLNAKDKIVIGISTYNQDVQGVLEKIRLVKDKFGGYAFFSYNSLQKRKMLGRLLPHFVHKRKEKTGGS